MTHDEFTHTIMQMHHDFMGAVETLRKADSHGDLPTLTNPVSRTQVPPGCIHVTENREASLRHYPVYTSNDGRDWILVFQVPVNPLQSLIEMVYGPMPAYRIKGPGLYIFATLKGNAKSRIWMPAWGTTITDALVYQMTPQIRLAVQTIERITSGDAITLYNIVVKQEWR